MSRGESIPVVMIPRYSSYTGEGSFTTAPLDVSGFAKTNLVFYRSGLLGSGAGSPAFHAYFETSHDEITWFSEWDTTAVNTTSQLGVSFTRRWFRVRIDLVGDTQKVCGITCWAIGTLERRTEG